jgi:hypothetical protein
VLQPLRLGIVDVGASTFCEIHMLSQKTSDKNGWKKSGHAASEEFDVP